MSKRAFIIHGWGGFPDNHWFPWLKQELEKNNFTVQIPAMPNPDNPTINEWVGSLALTVGVADENTFFIGHSIGCQTILRYLEQLPENIKIGGLVCVAGFFRLLHLETEEEKIIAAPWLDTPINFEKIKKHTNKISAIFSDNDPDVDLDNKKLFKKYLNAKTIVEHNKEHFTADAGITELLSALQAVLEMSK